MPTTPEINPTFSQMAQALHDKAFTVKNSVPPPYLTKLGNLMMALLETGASIDEARTALQHLDNEWRQAPAE